LFSFSDGDLRGLRVDLRFMAISGHARSSLPQVMPHYYTPGSEEAASGIAKMWTWMQRRGIKL